MIRLVVVVAALMVLASQRGEAQSRAVGVTRMQRLVGALHVGPLKPARPITGSGVPAIDPGAMLPATAPTLRQQVRLPLFNDVDLTITGRLNPLGPSTQARLRIRF